MARDPLTSVLSVIGSFFALITEVFVGIITRPPRMRLVRDQLYEIGVASLPVVAITGFSTGLVLSAQSYFQLADKGLAGATGIMVTKAMIVELGPILTAFMVTGRVGAAMCAELGTMRVTEQIDAMKSMAVDPNRYLLAPRFLAGILVMPLLTIFSSLMGVLGGYLIAVGYYEMPSSTFLDPLPEQLRFFDYFTGLTKAFAFGVIIVTISCYRGLLTKGGAAGVGRATTNSVVICYSVILISNFFITIGLNNSYNFLNEFFNVWLK